MRDEELEQLPLRLARQTRPQPDSLLQRPQPPLVPRRRGQRSVAVAVARFRGFRAVRLGRAREDAHQLARVLRRVVAGEAAQELAHGVFLVARSVQPVRAEALQRGGDGEPHVRRRVPRLGVLQHVRQAVVRGGVQVVVLLREVVQQAPAEAVAEERGHERRVRAREQRREEPEPEEPPLVRPARHQPALHLRLPQRLQRARDGVRPRRVHQQHPHRVRLRVRARGRGERVAHLLQVRRAEKRTPPRRRRDAPRFGKLFRRLASLLLPSPLSFFFLDGRRGRRLLRRDRRQHVAARAQRRRERRPQLRGEREGFRRRVGGGRGDPVRERRGALEDRGDVPPRAGGLGTTERVGDLQDHRARGLGEVRLGGGESGNLLSHRRGEIHRFFSAHLPRGEPRGHRADERGDPEQLAHQDVSRLRALGGLRDGIQRRLEQFQPVGERHQRDLREGGGEREGETLPGAGSTGSEAPGEPPQRVHQHGRATRERWRRLVFVPGSVAREPSADVRGVAHLRVRNRARNRERILRAFQLVHQTHRAGLPRLRLHVREVPKVLQHVPGHLQAHHRRGARRSCARTRASACGGTRKAGE